MGSTGQKIYGNGGYDQVGLSPDWIDVKGDFEIDHLRQGDKLVLQTRNQSIYQLAITAIDKQIYANLTDQKILQSGKPSTIDEAPIIPVVVYGSCERVIPEANEDRATVVGGNLGILKLGRSAWFGVSRGQEILPGREIRPSVTYPISAIFYRPSVSPSSSETNLAPSGMP